MRYQSTILIAFFCSSALAQDKKVELCSARTTMAYHSSQCDWGYVVRDPKKVGDVTISHKPAYHTYSRWVLEGQTYILAYRDFEYRPDDMAVDVYVAGQSGYTLIGNARIPGIVTGVSTATLTGGAIPDLVIQFEAGQLQYVDVLRFSGGSVHQVFQYGASTIKLVVQPTPILEATSKIANVVEQFAWDQRSGKFSKISERTRP